MRVRERPRGRATTRSISSVPLPDLIADDRRRAARRPTRRSQRLACSTCVLVNVGVDRPDVTDKHITYFYDEDILFSRLSFPHLLSPNNAPPGPRQHPGGGLLLARSTSRSTAQPEDLDRTRDRATSRVRTDRERDEIIYKGAVFCEYANIIFDHDREKALDDGPRLSRRHRHRMLRALRRLGLHVDRRLLQERRARRRKRALMSTLYAGPLACRG